MSKERPSAACPDAEPGLAERLLEFGSESVTLLDADGRVRAVRGAPLPVEGHRRQLSAGADVADVLAPGEWERLTELRHEVAATPGAVIEADVELRTGGGATRTFGARVQNCLDDPLLRGFVIVTRDITEERTLVSELARRRRTAEAVVDARTRLLATVTHELRNPLHAVYGIAELLAAEELEPTAAELAGSLVRQLASLTRVTHDLLDAVTLDAGTVAVEPVPTDLAALIRDVVDLGRAAAGGRPLSITSRIAHGVPEWVLVDSDRLRQVLGNLIGNAVKFTERGSVQLVVRTDGLDLLDFSVLDTGVGIPAGEQQAILEPFTVASTAGPARGAGLGLSIVNRLVEAMGGSVALTSAVGSGTQIAVSIPLVACDPPLAVGRPPTGAGLRVLVVEDNPVNQQLAKRQLERLGFEPTLAVTGEEGLELLKRAGPGGFDVVLMDQQLPGWSGAETTRRIRALGGELGSVPVIGVSASMTPNDRAAFHAAGMDGLVEKPATLHDLASAIRAVDRRDEPGGRTPSPDGREGPSTVATSVAEPGVLDVEMLGRLADELDDIGIVRGLVTSFLDELDGRVAAIVAPAGAASAAHAAHTLKSTARLVGANQLADACRAIEHEETPATAVRTPATRARAALERWLVEHPG